MTPLLHRAAYGITASGDPVERLVLSNARGMRVGLLTFGGVIDEIAVPDPDGRIGNVVLALRDLAAYEATPNFGSLVGRYANRISGGGFTLDGHFYPLSKDPDAIVLHGGSPGFASRIWAVAESGVQDGIVAVTLRYVSPDGENGFPGELDVRVTFSLSPDNRLTLEYVATTSAATVVNLTHHGYFNLVGGGRGSIDEQIIQIFASHYAPIDARQNATGTIDAVAGALDLREPVRIGACISADEPQLALANGFNHSFAVEGWDGTGLRLAARALDPISGRTLEVQTTEPAVHLYTANEFDGRLAGAQGRRFRQGAGFALETQHYPDSPNQPAFPTTVLRPGAAFRSITSFGFGVVGS